MAEPRQRPRSLGRVLHDLLARRLEVMGREPAPTTSPAHTGIVGTRGAQGRKTGGWAGPPRKQRNLGTAKRRPAARTHAHTRAQVPRPSPRPSPSRPAPGPPPSPVGPPQGGDCAGLEAPPAGRGQSCNQVPPSGPPPGDPCPTETKRRPGPSFSLGARGCHGGWAAPHAHPQRAQARLRLP